MTREDYLADMLQLQKQRDDAVNTLEKTNDKINELRNAYFRGMSDYDLLAYIDTVNKYEWGTFMDVFKGRFGCMENTVDIELCNRHKGMFFKFVKVLRNAVHGDWWRINYIRATDLPFRISLSYGKSYDVDLYCDDDIAIDATCRICVYPPEREVADMLGLWDIYGKEHVEL